LVRGRPKPLLVRQQAQVSHVTGNGNGKWEWEWKFVHQLVRSAASCGPCHEHTTWCNGNEKRERGTMWRSIKRKERLLSIAIPPKRLVANLTNFKASRFSTESSEVFYILHTKRIMCLIVC